MISILYGYILLTDWISSVDGSLHHNGMTTNGYVEGKH